ncbi:[5-(aminomethyl)furan-3-yl]methyl phosphate kinase [Methanothermococcus okinawensis]|uniref:Aspartate/glutamate/uridylate kinase n=1 Tax=Methanothermococcus okinawensis (strain DSM 14208 / JCM 11175 / IH1) TaxID=647113 RepID=F8AM58_METOI|nr:[5-(aminomethyl)furan-3-yl]methyl phosphate kinase [Methanothermococcus okinawensis]AEH06743.1 aspartate/glutamate/uridylate kinase [Methanothermococcus okinawensis IH1]
MHLIKIGGSLTYYAKPLLNKLKRFSDEYEEKIIVVPGGGAFANVVRELNEKGGLNNRSSHKLATMSMDMMGIYFSEISNIKTADNLYDAKYILKNDNIVILLPSKIVLSTDELPCSWDVTSDSIGAHIARLLNLNSIIIATDVDGIYDNYPEGKLLNTINAKSIKGFTSVDSYLPKLLLKHNIECFVVNGKYPDRIISILKNNNDIYTKINLQ